MKTIKFNTNTIEIIREYATSHTFKESCNRFTLTPNVLKRIAKKHGISFICRKDADITYIASSAYDISDVVNLFPEYDNIREDGNGNIVCDKPAWYTGRKSSNCVFLHNLVFCKAIGITELPKGFIVYHADGDKRNLSIDNLLLCTISCSGKLNLWKA